MRPRGGQARSLVAGPLGQSAVKTMYCQAACVEAQARAVGEPGSSSSPDSYAPSDPYHAPWTPCNPGLHPELGNPSCRATGSRWHNILIIARPCHRSVNPFIGEVFPSVGVRRPRGPVNAGVVGHRLSITAGLTPQSLLFNAPAFANVAIPPKTERDEVQQDLLPKPQFRFPLRRGNPPLPARPRDQRLRVGA